VLEVLELMSMTHVKTMAFVLLLSAAAGGLFAGPWSRGPSELEKEAAAILAQRSSDQLGTMTVGDVEKILGELSVARQKSAYVHRASMASFMMPGAGQFMTGDPLAGALFAAGDVALLAGTLVGAYYLLPANVQIGGSGLDYLNAPVSTIKAAWEANSILSYLPSVGVLAAGMLVKHALGWWSSDNASATARRNIEDGKVSFQPELFPLLGHGAGPGGGMGMMMRWRY
jgi:hypothetical protein